MSKSIQEYSPVDLVEEALYVIKANSRLLISYYVGSLPFVLALLYFWADLSHAIFDTYYCVQAAFGLAFCYIWMKSWHAMFAHFVYRRLSDAALQPWTIAQYLRLFTVQAFIHSSVFVVLPASLLIGLPFAWVFAFYHNTSAVYHPSKGVRSVVSDAWRQAKLWPRQNHILVCIYVLFYITAFLNIAVVIYTLPHLLKKFFGVETVFSMSGFNMLNSTYIITAFSLTYLTINPLIKVVYTLRVFYGNAIQSGDDLLVRLNTFKKNRTTQMLNVVCALLFVAVPIQASESVKAHPMTVAETSASVVELDSSIERILEQREYRWRMPPGEIIEEDGEDSAIKLFFKWAAEKFRDFYTTFRDAVHDFMDWLSRVLPVFDTKPKDKPKSQSFNTSESLRIIGGVLVLAFIVCIGFIALKRRSKDEYVPEDTIMPMPDITDEQVKADELPPDEWLVMANDLLSRGDCRHAIRAFYLASLSHLAKCEVLRIERYKSNFDYQNELNRRAHHNADLRHTFSHCINIFNAVWYGRLVVERVDVEAFAKEYQKIVELAHA